VFEQYAHNRLIRPQATYVGPAVHPYETMTEREAHAGSAT
jgi:citrate synthase